MRFFWMKGFGVLAFAACQQPHLALLPQLEAYEGKYVTYYVTPSLTPCAGNLAYLDGFVEFLADQLGHGPPPGLHALWLDQTDYVSTECEASWGACARGDFAMSTKPVHLHEFIHVIANRFSMNKWSFFMEGIAEAYDPWNTFELGSWYLRTEGGEPFPAMDWLFTAKRLLDKSGQTEPPGLAYAFARTFTTNLLARYGPRKFAEFARSLPPNRRKMSKLRSAFRTVYGHEFDDAYAEFSVAAPCPDDASAVPVYDCAMPEVAWDNWAWRYEAQMFCENPDVIGGYSEDAVWPSIHSVTVEIPESRVYAVAMQARSNDYKDAVYGALVPCTGCVWDRPGQEGYHFSAENWERVLHLEAGRYAVRTYSDDSRAAREVAWSILPTVGEPEPAGVGVGLGDRFVASPRLVCGGAEDDGDEMPGRSH